MVGPFGVPVSPTAQALPADVAATAVSSPGTGFGAVTGVHFVPFQCSSSVIGTPPEDLRMPTAHALVREVAATPNSSPLTWYPVLSAAGCATAEAPRPLAARAPPAPATTAAASAIPATAATVRIRSSLRIRLHLFPGQIASWRPIVGSDAAKIKGHKVP